MKNFNIPIPENKLGQFDQILKSCGGRWIRNPEKCADQYGYWRCSVEFDEIENANTFNKRFERVCRPIEERVKKKSWLNKLRRLFK